jgi:hypothetical protein
MIYPTMSVLTSGAILVAILLMADWYVWRLAVTRKLRQSHPDKPRGMGGAVEDGPSAVTATGNSAHADGHGFKKVA